MLGRIWVIEKENQRLEEKNNNVLRNIQVDEIEEKNRNGWEIRLEREIMSLGKC